VAENVAGLVSSDHGDHYRQLHAALLARGYVAGALHLDAIRWLPQSRPRVFVVATPADADLSKRSASGPTWAHSPAIRRLGESLSGWVWWKLPEPKRRERRLVDILDLSAPCDDEAAAKRNLSLIPPKHEAKLISALGNGFVVAPGYKRTRHSGQRLELRFDGVAGCLRTPEGGSSRQFLVIRRDDGTLATRLITAREAARMMGARDSYRLPENYNDGYRAMGDAVAVPVARHLSGHLLAPLAKDAKARTSPGRTPHCPWH